MRAGFWQVTGWLNPVIVELDGLVNAFRFAAIGVDN